MRIHNLYEDADGESHFRDVEVDWVEESPSGRLSKRLPATGIVFRETTADYENSWHRAPRRQYLISLAAGISVTASDGQTRDYFLPMAPLGRPQIEWSAALGGMRWLMQKLWLCARNWRAARARIITANGAATSMRAACNTAWGRMSK